MEDGGIDPYKLVHGNTYKVLGNDDGSVGTLMSDSGPSEGEDCLRTRKPSRSCLHHRVNIGTFQKVCSSE
jgi:hypothetical protein